ncbi:MAG TPA: 16S rRNA (adenine(1518)-N(6)/adenine(1519)-N(6))-dimethyltransferase RsmA [Methylomirabilota bacterium]|nr:16S rRNA (adenine(1518)-N(6)/adenine(1519)-N(6))-dimethyltransferase RsmA [Methylomirabilota bacterium]
MTRRRALGQHFLRDAGTARAIVDLVEPTARDLVVEIGPGEGALTAELARRAGRLIALEVDRALLERLRRRFPAVELLEADARTWDYGMLERPAGGRVLVVGNLPYSVGKPIVAALLEARAAIDVMALMLQREVAERLAAPPGSRVYGALSVLTQAVCEVELALRVPPGAFRPPPKVESAVVRLTPRGIPLVPAGLETRFREVVKAAFSSRRKTLANALAGGLGVPLGTARNAATTCGVDPGRRAETLNIDEFVALTGRL